MTIMENFVQDHFGQQQPHTRICNDTADSEPVAQAGRPTPVPLTLT